MPLQGRRHPSSKNLKLAPVWGNICQLCLPTFPFLISSPPAPFFFSPSPAVSNHYGCLPSGSALTVLSGSRRICHCEGDDESPLITPCHCTGSLRFVHQSCLQQWIKSSDTRCCELCKYEFIMETKLKPLRKVSDARRRRSGFRLAMMIPPSR